jgi:oligopeptide/dipeptide ABC transporter ATP-binding protein
MSPPTANNKSKSTILLEVNNLWKYFPIARGGLAEDGKTVRAVDGVSFSLRAGETLGLVGESGCGKSTTGRAVLRLIEPDGGEIVYDGKKLLTLPTGEMKSLRRELQIIFQDPYASLNPKKTVGQILAEPFLIHGIGKTAERPDSVRELLRRVGLSPDHADRYPHEFSGGQRQRIGIARAIALRPRLIVADEPVSALDVSIRAQILNLMQDLQESLGVAYLFISHDMGIVEHFCDRVAVMYLGKIVETADRQQLYASPRHPYTSALLAAVPTFNDKTEMQPVAVRGDLPDPANPPPGCAFHPRCPIKEKQCETVIPELKEIAPGHAVACHLR